MKKIILGIVSLLLLFSLLACASNTTAQEETTTKENETTTTKEEKTTKERDIKLPETWEYYEEDMLMLHYNRSDNTYSPWSLWMWAANKDGSRYEFNYMDSFGAIAYYSLSELKVDTQTELGLIVAMDPGGSWAGKDTDADRFVDFSMYDKDEHNIYHVYVFSGVSTLYSSEAKTQADRISSLSFEDDKTIKATTNNAISKYSIYENDTLLVENDTDGTSFTYVFSNERPFSYSNNYKAVVTFKDSGKTIERNIPITNLYELPSFDEAYYYDGDLGALYSSSSTTFKVWSPVSSKIELKLYSNGTPLSVDEMKGSDTTTYEIEMTKGDKGVFSATVEGDLSGMYYTYKVYNSSYPYGAEIVDPYAKSTGVNGLRGMVVNFGETNPDGWDDVTYLDYDRKELTVWETHVADVTSSSTWNGTEENRKKFIGLIEEGTTYTANEKTVKTGFDHIKELGVNAVQLIPIFDQANDEVNVEFNWGYNPLNYNALEGAYSLDPYNGYTKIREFKEVVKAFNEAGITVIMDVVYNHVNGAKGSNFDVLVPGYYFRYDADGNLYNGSGCGNETASDHSMFRKFMIDSVTFWTEEYKLGGFRFDLMGLHDIDTMNALTRECQEINPNIVIYGEPWTGGTSGLANSLQAKQSNEAKFEGYGAFNDLIRDELVKGGLSAATALSWISNTSNSISTNFKNLNNGIKGITLVNGVSNGPDKTLNYATCHDNYTLYDRFRAAGVKDPNKLKAMAMLANSIVFTSQGTSFMLAGEEFLRTKQGNSNSYNASYKVNELDYSLKLANLDMFENYKALIYLKQHTKALQLGLDDASTIEITRTDSSTVLYYTLTDTETNTVYFICHSNGVKVSERTAIDLTGYKVYLDTIGVYEKDADLDEFTPGAFQTLIAYKQAE